MTLQAGKQIIAIHISLNISKSKWNQRMKFDQSIEYNMRKVFLKKEIYAKYGGETSRRLFIKKIKIEHIPGSTV